MKLKMTTCIAIIGVFCGVFGILIGQSTSKVDTQASSRFEPMEIFRLMEKQKILRASLSEVDGFGTLLTQRLEPVEANSAMSTSQKLSLYDKSGKEVFSKIDFGIKDYYFDHLTKGDADLVIKTNGGGTDDFIDIYTLKNGKFEEIVDKNETQMRGGYWIVPEYRTGVDGPYFKPPQLFVIDQIGGIDDDPQATIFRYRNGRYEPTGKIKMKELGDFVEKHLTKTK